MRFQLKKVSTIFRSNMPHSTFSEKHELGLSPYLQNHNRLCRTNPIVSRSSLPCTFLSIDWWVWFTSCNHLNPILHWPGSPQGLHVTPPFYPSIQHPFSRMFVHFYWMLFYYDKPRIGRDARVHVLGRITYLPESSEGASLNTSGLLSGHTNTYTRTLQLASQSVSQPSGQQVGQCVSKPNRWKWVNWSQTNLLTIICLLWLTPVSASMQALCVLIFRVRI